MFSQKYRLRSEKDILRVLRSRQSVFDAACGVKYAKNDLSHPRFVIVISTKVSKLAVERNRARRQYREICKEFLGDMPSCDIGLIVSRPALELDYWQKREKLKRVFLKAKLITHVE